MDTTALLGNSVNSNLVRTKEEEDEEAGIRAGRIANAAAFPMVLKAAMEMGVIDLIHDVGEDQWLSSSMIAKRLPTKPSNPHAPMLLDRILSQLASYSIVKCRTVPAGGDNGQTGETQRVYAAEPICRFLLIGKTETGSVGPLFLVAHSQAYMKMWFHLKDMVLEGKAPFHCAHGTNLYEYLPKDEAFHELFHRAMAEHSIMIMKKLLEVYNGFENVKVLVDVGGSDGTTLSLITAKYPHIKGINYELPDVVAKAPPFPGVEHVAGDMFVEVPKADAIFTKRSIHGWNDEDSIRILKNCWKALPESGGRVIIMETILPSDPEGGDYSHFGFDLDVLLLTLCAGGKERTRADFEELARKSGFDRCEFICRAYYCWVIEFHKDPVA